MDKKLSAKDKNTPKIFSVLQRYSVLFFCLALIILLCLLVSMIKMGFNTENTVAVATSVFLIAVGIVFISHYLYSLYDRQKRELIEKDELLRETTSKLENLADCKDVFLGHVARELRTVTTSIGGMNDLILRDAYNDKVREYAEGIKTTNNSLTVMVNNLQDLAAVNSGEMEIEENEYSVSEMMKELYDYTNVKMVDSKAELRFNSNPKVYDKVIGDSRRIKQIVTNLLTNSVNHTSHGYIELYLDYYVTEDKDVINLIIGVRDTGDGIPKAVQPYLFEPSKRFSSKTKALTSGMGLGLIISYSLISRMAGSIHFQSSEGIGSVFEVEIPQRISEDQSRVGDLTGAIRKKWDKNYSHKALFTAPDANLLVVDDINTNLEVVRGLLEPTRIQVDCVTSAMQALEQAKIKKYDLILMDHLMPHVDGVEALKLFMSEENLNKETPMIVLTANVAPGAREEYMALGFADYIAKPVSTDSLEKMIKIYIPAEKIKSQDPDIVVAIKTPEVNFTASIDFLDTDAAMKNLNNSEQLYLTTLKAYLADYDPTAIEDAYKKHDELLYRTKIHGVKSAAMSIGAMELGAIAKAIEDAIRAEDFDYVEENHDKFMEKYIEMAEKLTKFFFMHE